MNKQQKIAFFKKQAETAKEMQAVAMQNFNLATRIESEANSALEVLGESSGRARKGKEKYEIPIDVKLSLMASLTK